jgi:WD40 repeat protein
MEEFNRREAEIRAKLLQKEFTEDMEYIKVGGSPAKGIRLRQVLEGHSDRIQHINWSPDGKYLASPADDNTVRIWDEATGDCVFTLQEEDEVKHCVWTPDSQDLIYGGASRIRKWNIQSRKMVDLLQDDYKRLDSLVFSPDGTRLALAYGFDTIQVIDTLTSREITRRVFDQRTNSRIHLEWSDDGSQIIANPQLGFLQILDAQTLKSIKVIQVPGDRNPLYGFSFLYAKSGNVVAVAEEKKPILIINLANGEVEKKLADSITFTSGLTYSPDGNLLVSWCQDSSVYFWRMDTGQKLTRVHEYSLRMIEPVFPVFHPIKPSLVTFCDKRRSMRLWDIDYKELLSS